MISLRQQKPSKWELPHFHILPCTHGLLLVPGYQRAGVLSSKGYVLRGYQVPPLPPTQYFSASDIPCFSSSSLFLSPLLHTINLHALLFSTLKILFLDSMFPSNNHLISLFYATKVLERVVYTSLFFSQLLFIFKNFIFLIRLYMYMEINSISVP